MRKKGERKPIPKTWEFYRRRGFLWSDPYHVPEEKRKFTERPDLDAKFEQYLQKRDKEQQALEDRQLREKKRRIKKIRSRLHARQMENFEKDIYKQNTDEELPNKSPKSKNLQRKERIREKAKEKASKSNNEHNVKDRFFYRRTGFLWSDLKMVPQDRFHLVVNQRIAEQDWWATEQIQKRIDEEGKQREEREREKQARVEEIREEFQRQQDTNATKWESMGLLSFKRSPQRQRERPSTATPGARRMDSFKSGGGFCRPSSCNSHKRPVSPVEGYVQTLDHAGLLHFDTAIQDRLLSAVQKPNRRPHSAFTKTSSNSKGKVPKSSELETNQCSPLKKGATTLQYSSSLSALKGVKKNKAGDTFSEGDGVSEIGEGVASLALKSCLHLEQVPSLSHPTVVLGEIDAFEERLKVLEETGETSKPFYLHY